MTTATGAPELARSRRRRFQDALGWVLFVTLNVGCTYETVAILVGPFERFYRLLSIPLVRIENWSGGIAVLLLLRAVPQLSRFAQRMFLLGACGSWALGIVYELSGVLQVSQIRALLVATFLTFQAVSLFVLIAELRQRGGGS